jgi:hypothetical protein
MYLVGNQWIDPQVQSGTDGRPTRIRWGSPEYFQLLSQKPAAAAFLALGRNVKFMLGRELFEIHE